MRCRRRPTSPRVNSGAPLVFGDKTTATEVLQAFSALPNVTAATLFSLDGSAFARYRRADARIDETARAETRPDRTRGARGLRHRRPGEGPAAGPAAGGVRHAAAARTPDAQPAVRRAGGAGDHGAGLDRGAAPGARADPPAGQAHAHRAARHRRRATTACARPRSRATTRSAHSPTPSTTCSGRSSSRTTPSRPRVSRPPPPAGSRTNSSPRCRTNCARR